MKKKTTTTAEEGEKEERRNWSAQKRKTQTLWSLFGIWKTTEREKDKNEKCVEDETQKDKKIKRKYSWKKNQNKNRVEKISMEELTTKERIE